MEKTGRFFNPLTLTASVPDKNHPIRDGTGVYETSLTAAVNYRDLADNKIAVVIRIGTDTLKPGSACDQSHEVFGDRFFELLLGHLRSTYPSLPAALPEWQRTSAREDRLVSSLFRPHTHIKLERRFAVGARRCP